MPMQLRRLAPAILSLMVVACNGGSSTPPPPVPATTASSGPTRTASPLPKALTHVVVDQTIAGHYQGTVKSFVRISGGGIRRTLSIPSSTGSRLFDLQRVASYTVRSFQQPCRSSCNSLLHPVDGCGTTFTANGEVVRLAIVVTPGTGCTITRS
jgi:hypothetical protein